MGTRRSSTCNDRCEKYTSTFDERRYAWPTSYVETRGFWIRNAQLNLNEENAYGEYESIGVPGLRSNGQKARTARKLRCIELLLWLCSVVARALPQLARAYSTYRRWAEHTRAARCNVSISAPLAHRRRALRRARKSAQPPTKSAAIRRLRTAQRHTPQSTFTVCPAWVNMLCKVSRAGRTYCWQALKARTM